MVLAAFLAVAGLAACEARSAGGGSNGEAATLSQVAAEHSASSAAAVVTPVQPVLFGPAVCARSKVAVEETFIGGESNQSSVTLIVDRVPGSKASVDIDLNGRRVIRARDFRSGTTRVERVVDVFDDNHIRVVPVVVAEDGVVVRVVGHAFSVSEFTLAPETAADGQQAICRIQATVGVPVGYDVPTVVLERIGTDGVRIDDLVVLQKVGRSEGTVGSEQAFAATATFFAPRSRELLVRLRIECSTVVEYSEGRTVSFRNDSIGLDSTFVTTFQEKLLSSYMDKTATLGHQGAAQAVLAEAQANDQVTAASLCCNDSQLTIRYRFGLEGGVTLRRPY